jgi:hypothetical protein
MTAYLRETLRLSSVMLVKAFARLEIERARFAGINAELRRRHVHAAMTARRFGIGLGTLQTAGPMVLLLVGPPRRRSRSPRADRESHLRRGGYRRPKVLDQVGRCLDPAGQPHQVCRHRRRGALDRLVGHRLGHLDQRLDAAE